MSLAGRHSWTQEGERLERHTDRACYLCGLIKRTRHEGGRSWAEFHQRQPDGSLARVPGKATPPCPGSPEQQTISFKPSSDVITNGDSHEADH
jgi:hypothetical protein